MSKKQNYFKIVLKKLIIQLVIAVNIWIRMKRIIIFWSIVAIVIVLVIIGASTGVLPGKVFPLLKKAAMAVPPRMSSSAIVLPNADPAASPLAPRQLA